MQQQSRLATFGRTTSISDIRMPPRPRLRDFNVASLAANLAARRADGSAARPA